MRIVPPEGVTVDPKRRPYVIIDPRAGHGPGIGGFKDDSQVGVALREGHPVYFVIFFRDPEPGQTLLDVCDAEQQFVKKVRALHPASPKPAIVGNCQGGWAAMMLAASDPEDTGPIVINGAPMSYWGGAFQEGAGDNPMRYAGGMLGGTWLSSFAADMGDGVFDGAYLVENFENLNPANTFWDKYYNLFANIDTEPPRFLEFERWWGGFYLMNREEIEWITRNLFVGNKLWSGTKGTGGKAFDLRDIKAPIVLFASMGDNITPPQQAFNWVADVYGSTDEIKARGQVIVGLLHQDIGHLGIFVSGKVAKKEHAQIVSVLKSIESLPPGLYGMQIHEVKGRDGKVEYEVDFHERRLEDIAKQLNRLERADEKPFEAVAAIVGVQPARLRALRAAVRPVDGQRGHREGVAAVPSAALPALGVLGPQSLARVARPGGAGGQGAAPGGRRRQPGPQGREDGVRGHQRIARLLPRGPRRDQRGGVLPDLRQRVLALPRRQARGRASARRKARPSRASCRSSRRRWRRSRKAALPRRWPASASLLARRGAPLPLARLALKQELTAEYRDLLPDLAPDEWRRIRGEQDIIVRYEPEKAIAALPKLLAKPGDRERLVTLVRRLLADERMRRFEPTTEQLAMIENIGETLDVDAGTGPGQGAGTEGGPQARREAAQGPRDARDGQMETRMERKHEKYQRLIDVCKTLPPTPTAVAHPCDESSLRGAVDAAQARPDRADPGRSARADRGGREASTASTSRDCRSSTRRTARPPPKRRWSWCARARPRR